MKIYAIIPARGGSKGIPRKNIKIFRGKPLIAHTILQAQQNELFEKIVVTTDDKEIAVIAATYGATILMRPAEIAGDLSTDYEFMEHAIEHFPECDIWCQLRPTFPLRKWKDIQDAIEVFDYKNFSSLRSVVEMQHSVYKTYFLDLPDEIGSATLVPTMKHPSIKEPFNAPRQILPTSYFHNGCIDIVTKQTILNEKSITGAKIQPFIMSKENDGDIDTMEQWNVLNQPSYISSKTTTLPTKYSTMNFTQTYEEPKIIAEVGCNHKGDMKIALELIDLAKQAGCCAVKFQKRNPKELLSKEQYNAPHPVPRNSYGKTYGEHREKLEFTAEQHKELMLYCNGIGITYSTSVWDVTSAIEIVSLDPHFIKVGSPSNLHWEMMQILRDEYDGQVHISTGMTTKEEIEQIIQFWEKGKGDAKRRVVLYACTSGYPVPFEDVCLLEITKLKSLYSNRVRSIAFSGHHLGVAIDIAAYTLGAHWIERHFTKDRTWKGTDHAASLEPSGMTKLCRNVQAVSKALNSKQKDILEIEKPQRLKLKWGGKVGPV